MATNIHPELEAKLQELDHELEDGDITRKGYEKRRTLLFSEYLGAGQEEQQQYQPDIRISNPSPNNDDRTMSFADRSTSSQYAQSQHGSVSGPPGNNGGYMAYPPPSHAGRFQEREMGMRPPLRQGSMGSDYRPVTPDGRFSNAYSREGTMVNSDYAFNPGNQYATEGSPGDNSRLSTMLDSQQGYFSDFAGDQMQVHRESYGGGHNRYSQGEAFSPTAAIPPPMLGATDLPGLGVIECQLPLEPREVPFAVFDPHNGNVPMAKFDNIGAVLRHRGKMNGRQPAYWVLDPKGKETASITWEKLASRAEKVAQVIRDKSNLYRGDRVALVYRDTEVIDFAIALFGCFIAGVVAVPMNSVDDYQKLSLLLTTTQAHLALTTENNLKAFHRDISNQRLKWPAGVEWWKTNEFGSYHPKKKDDEKALVVPDLAYIEFSRAPTGDLRGVVLSHRTIMHQMACLTAIMTTIPLKENTDTFSATLRDPAGNLINAAPRTTRAETIISYLDPREGVGMLLGVLLGCYGGHTTVWLEAKTVETPGLYAHLLTKYRSTVMVADYPGLKRAAYNYQQDPMSTRNFKKNTEPNFSTVKFCSIVFLTALLNSSATNQAAVSGLALRLDVFVVRVVLFFAFKRTAHTLLATEPVAHADDHAAVLRQAQDRSN